MESADTQITMLIELARRSQADPEGRVLVGQAHLVETLERIRQDHRQELQMVPTIAGRMLDVFGVTV